MATISDSIFKRRIQLLINSKWIKIPDESKYGGTGGPGRLLEDELGVNGSNDDLPDAGRWELKFHSGTSLITLFHKEALPQGHLLSLITKYGWVNNQSRRCFRHTIRG